VAAIAVTHSVDNIAAQSYQAPVFPDKIKRDRRDFKSSMNSCLISLVIVVMGDDAPRIGDHSRDNDGNECGDDPSGLEKLAAILLFIFFCRFTIPRF